MSRKKKQYNIMTPQHGWIDNIIYGCSNPMVNGVSGSVTTKCDGDCDSCQYRTNKIKKVYK